MAFNNSGKDKWLRGHWGGHDRNCQNLYSHDHFREVVRRVAKRLANYAFNASVVWSVYCSVGKHRSVGVSLLLQGALEKLRARCVLNFKSYEAGLWTELCTTCASCQESTSMKAGIINELSEELSAAVMNLQGR